MGDAMAEFASRYETLLLRRERSRLSQSSDQFLPFQ